MMCAFLGDVRTFASDPANEELLQRVRVLVEEEKAN